MGENTYRDILLQRGVDSHKYFGVIGTKDVTSVAEIKNLIGQARETSDKTVTVHFMAVSYTHLDVYKRQDLSCVRQ